MSTRVHVAVGIIINHSGQILLAKRHGHLHQGGKWEFPGGKIENNETTAMALARELKEEVGIEVFSSQPFITIHHDYNDKQVLLDVHLVSEFAGTPSGLEGQRILWADKDQLLQLPFPDANQPIIDKLMKADP